MRPVLAITHARFSPERRQTLNTLMNQLRVEAPDLPVIVASDDERKGSLWCWRQAMELALLDPEVTHVVWLPDDAIVCRDFGAILRACIAARPGDVFDCYVNMTTEVSTCWYSTPDGYVGMGGCMPRDLLIKHLRWRDTQLLDKEYPNDAGVNLWAMTTGRLIYKTAWTLVDHDDRTPSIDGNGACAFRTGERWVDSVRIAILEEVGNFLGRTYAAPEEHMPGRARSCTDLGRTYKGNHWGLVSRVAEPWDVDAMYRLECPPPAERPRVVILVPCYREAEEILRHTRPAIEAIMDDLASHGCEVTKLELPGDSHVDRMRQRGTHQALKHGATHVLWCDADIEPLDPKVVRRMLLTGKDVIAGACPFKDDTGRVVCNLWPDDVESGELRIDKGCVEVQDAGTGFMLVSRKALVALMQAHPELLHFSRSKGDTGEPLWAIWDAQVHERVFLTEDYAFCKLWQDLGGRVYVFAQAEFRHWGLHGFRGSLMEQWGLASKGA